VQPGTGIGFEISRAFAAAGVSRICIMSRRPEPLAKSKQELEKEFKGLRVDTYAVSVSDYAVVSEAVKQIGQVDVIALSAAYVQGPDPLDQALLDGMESSYNVNVVGNWNLVKSALNVRTDKTKQCIVLNVSTLAAYRPFPRQGIYGSSKAAFTQLMTEFSREYDESEVRFVSYHPGAVYTELASEHFDKSVFEAWEDVKLPGQFAVWLASPEADFLNGRFAWAEWDVDELLELRDKIKKDEYFLKISLIQ